MSSSTTKVTTTSKDSKDTMDISKDRIESKKSIESKDSMNIPKDKIDPIDNSVVNYFFNSVFRACLLFLVLGVLFKYGISPIISNIFEDHLNDTINKMSKPIDKLPESTKSKLQVLSLYGDPIDRLLAYYDHPDHRFETHNHWLFLTVWIVVILLSASLIFIAIVSYSLKSKIAFKDFLIINILTLVAIGSIEMAFFWYVGMKYVPAPPSLMTTTIINSLKKHLSETEK